jgi:hypothetical protein
MMKQRIGFWLSNEEINSMEVLDEKLADNRYSLDEKSRSFMMDEIKNQYALYFVQDKVKL